MSRRRAPRQDRSRQRREALLRAAIELLGETGVKSVTHRAVAERAGVPLASTTYYFRSVNELVEEALKLHVAERVAELSGLAEVALGVSGASATQIAERLAEVLVAAPAPTLVAQYQMYLEAGRNPALRAGGGRRPGRLRGAGRPRAGRARRPGSAGGGRGLRRPPRRLRPPPPRPPPRPRPGSRRPVRRHAGPVPGTGHGRRRPRATCTSSCAGRSEAGLRRRCSADSPHPGAGIRAMAGRHRRF